MAERPLASLNHLLSGLAFVPLLEFDPSVPEEERDPWAAAFRESFETSSLTVVKEGSPNAPPVSIRVAVTYDEGRTDLGVRYFAAQGSAVLELHRAVVEVAGRPGVAKDREEAVRAALRNLVEKVNLALTW
ncbi:MAG: hypothetical protein ACYTDY_08750 [Planctomycetota bacterium]